jgi:hypothetical protein
MNRNEMNAALKDIFVPALRVLGFKGSLPHFRRILAERVDILTVQFDRYGGGFVVEISRCSPEGITTPWGEYIPANKVTAHYLNSDNRHRLGSPNPDTDGRWFRFDDGTPPALVAKALLSYLDEAENWWTSV